MGTSATLHTWKDGEVERDLGGKVMKKRVETLAGGHYHIYFDNYFSSVKLLKDVQEDGLTDVGPLGRTEEEYLTTSNGRYNASSKDSRK